MSFWSASLALLAHLAFAPPAESAPQDIALTQQPQARGVSAMATASQARPKVYVALGSQSGSGTPATLVRARDGLFYLTAKVNGVAVRFLVDTGATTIVLTPDDAARAGITSDPDGAAQPAETAAGPVIMARVRIASLQAGPAMASDVEAAVSPPGLGVSLLGQTWLTQFKSITILRDRMILQ